MDRPKRVKKHHDTEKPKLHLNRMLSPKAPAHKQKKKSPDHLLADSLTNVSIESETSSKESQNVEIDMEAIYVEPFNSSIEVGTEASIIEPSSLCGSPDVNDDIIVPEDWLELEITDVCNSEDDELNNEILDDEPSPLPDRQVRSPANVPACITDMTAFETAVLNTEDIANDQALRDIIDNDCYTFDWNENRQTFHGQREIFTGTAGPTFEVSDHMGPIDIFDKMFDVDFIDSICTETNRYAAQKIDLMRSQKKLTTHSRFNRWTPTDRNEMITFLTIQVLQALYPLPDEESYFTFNGFATMPYFSKIMSYNRFLLLKIMLNFVDSQTSQDTSKLRKIRPIIDYFNQKFSSLYMPSQVITIDESLLKCYGRLTFAQKIKAKSTRVGIKTYELCESSSGYLWKFYICTGKDKSIPTTDDNDRLDERQNVSSLSTAVRDDRPAKATVKIVCDLIEPLLHRGHTLVIDNLYSSPLLVRHLKKQKTDCYGTIRLNRKFVPESMKTLTQTELRNGEVLATYCSDLSIMVWRDGNIVSMISTYHDHQSGTSYKKRVTYKPNIVVEYNKTMEGVDRKVQFLSAQPMDRARNRIWYKKLFRRLYDTALFNCFVIFSTRDKKITHHKFRTILAEDLLKRHRKIDLTTESRLISNTTGNVATLAKKPIRRNTTQARPVVDGNHFPIKTGSRATCCRLCPKKTRTVWKCEECNVNLCISGCFKAYHKP